MTKIIYHKNCMDGIAAAFIANHTLTQEGKEVQAIPLQYGEEQVLFGRDPRAALHEPLTKDDIIYFVDFSLKRDLMIELAAEVKEIIVLDHHKTAEQELQGLDEEQENITVLFDMESSGATMCYDYFMPHLQYDIFDYIEDRDLWKWKLPHSKEISAALRFKVKPNDLESFGRVYEDFDIEEFAKIGDLLLTQQQIQVNSKIKKTKEFTLHDITFKVLNATENISEIGNAICEQYGMPALVYFITEKDEVVCSLRSIDTLPDVSVVAKAMGGGGHRNACGFTLSLSDFFSMMTEPKFFDRPTIHKTVEEEYENFWKDIIEVDGAPDMLQIKKELYDFSQVMEFVPKVYCHITHSKISKILTLPDVVMSVADYCKEEEIEDALKEEIQTMNSQVSVFDENNEEQIITLHATNVIDEDGKQIYDLTEYIANRDMLKIQKYINNVPKELQTKENLDLLMKVLGLNQTHKENK